MKHAWPFANLFLCGLATVGAEVCAFRLLAPSFGSTQFITTNVLGVVLAALAAGYWFGGKLADRRPTATALAVVTLAGGIALAALPLAADPILAAARPAIDRQDASLFVGTLAATVGLFAIPIFLLGMVSPFTIRLLAEGDERAGSRSGAVFAISTVGSIAGAYLPSLVTIPWRGTRESILLFAAIVVVSGACGLFASRRIVGGAAALLVAMLPALAVAAPRVPTLARGVLEERETEYHLVRVRRDERDKRTFLEINEGLSYHSVVFDDGRLSTGVWGFFHLLPPAIVPMGDAGAATRPKLDVCIIGLAAGTMATQIQRYADRYELRIDGVELDSVLVDIGRRHFGLRDGDLRVFIEDGRTFLARHDERYDLIIGDAYRQPYIPPHLVTREFFDLVRARLKPGGVFAMNASAMGADSPVLLGIQNALVASFEAPAADGARGVVERFEITNADMPFINFVLLASAAPLRQRWSALDWPELAYFRDTALATWIDVNADPNAPSFTDDRAAVEWHTDASLFRYLAR